MKYNSEDFFYNKYMLMLEKSDYFIVLIFYFYVNFVLIRSFLDKTVSITWRRTFFWKKNYDYVKLENDPYWYYLCMNTIILINALFNFFLFNIYIFCINIIYFIFLIYNIISFYKLKQKESFDVIGFRLSSLLLILIWLSVLVVYYNS